MSTITVKELAAPTGFDLKIAAGETLDLKSQGTVTMPTGSVLQVVSASSGNETVTSSSSYVDVGSLSATITPSSTSSKILVLATLNGCLKNASNTSLKANIVRGSTQLQQMTAITMTTDSNAYIGVGTVSGEHLDSPNTTSATTYKCQIASVAGSANVRVNTSDNGGATSTITLMEIAG